MNEMISKMKLTLRADLLSGLTVSLALIPEAVAFSFVAGVQPLVGLYAAFIIGLITSLLGGRPGMISGATGALAVVIVALVASHGVEYLFATVVLMGIIQVTAGLFKLGKFARLIPHPVMIGFVNGLAIIIFLAQLSQFKYKNNQGIVSWLESSDMGLMLGLCAITMAIIHFFPKLTKLIPSTLVSILVVTGIVQMMGIDTRTVADMASVAGGLPSFHIPMVDFSLETLKIIFPYSIVMAAVGLIESLMTLQLIDEITETRGRSNQECIGQGLANILTGFFGGMGGCAMIGQSMINVNSGGRGRMSGFSAALFLLFFIVVGPKLIEQIPLAALVGVMFMVVIGTFEWTSLSILKKIPFSDAFVIVLVTTVTVFTDLAIAVFCGIIVSALVFAWKKTEKIKSKITFDEDGTKHYELNGPLFFGSVQSFTDLFNPKEDPEKIFLDFTDSMVCDYSSIEVLNSLVTKYEAQGKQVIIKNLSPDCKSVVEKAGSTFKAKFI